MAQKVRVTVAQYAVEIGKQTANEEKALEITRQAARNGSDIILLPELFSTEYFPAAKNPQYFSYAVPEDSPTIARFCGIAKEHQTAILLPYFEKAGSRYYNTMLYIDRSGSIAGRYRKVHIPAVRSIEKFYFRPGYEFPVFAAEWGTFGCLICQDRLFPEAARVLALKGADVLFIANAAGNYANFAAVWEAQHVMRAYENGCFVVTSNRVGTENGVKFFGKSLVAAPGGEILTAASDREETIAAELDLVQVAEMRNLLHIYRDYRPEMYREICRLE
ncbi:carbon-nitrogen hydrolase family protein [Brevibacillus marinus]|uniref:carbon-nitrogen hydrolase family protein n=1 Tax=Brevibacillus marinus TaxID=2496837 RepID=UPI0013E07906|nr:nitrilase-related carbon-nitrogen hydrolase [Brevibacillus marinus]